MSVTTEFGVTREVWLKPVSTDPTSAGFTNPQFMTVPSASVLSYAGIGQITLECWIYPTATPAAEAYILSKGTTANYEYAVLMFSDNHIYSQFKNSDGTGGVSKDHGAVTLNTWNHIAVTRFGGGVVTFLNGVANFVSVVDTQVAGNAAFRVGVAADGTVSFTGRVAEVAVYNTALTTGRISAHYAARALNYSATVLADSPAAYWRLGEASGATVAADSSVSASHPGSYPTASPVLGLSGPLTNDGVNSFLIRDDAYQKSGSKFSTSVSLGQPVNLSGNSNWRQDSWEGGVRQDLWNDQAMFMEGNADGDTKKGKLRMWPGMKSIPARAAGSPWVDRYVFAPSTIQPGTYGVSQDDPILWLGEGAWTNTQAGAYQLIQYRPKSDTIIGMYHPPTAPTTGPIRTILPMTEADYPSGILMVAFGAIGTDPTQGKIFAYVEATTTWAQDTNAYGDFGSEAGVVYGVNTYWLIGTQLWKRAPAASGFGVLGTWTLIKDVKSAIKAYGLAVWNNRLYYTVNFGSGKSTLLVSDGTNTNSVLDWPDNFVATRLLAHYGALYILGYKYGGIGGAGNILQLWKFTGAQLIKVYEEGMGEDNENHISQGLTASGPLLMWGRSGNRYNVAAGQVAPRPDTVRIAGSTRQRPGIMCYNAETDAIFEGPTLSMDARSNTVLVSNLYSWNNTVAVSFQDVTTYGTPAGPNYVAPNPVTAGYVRRNDQLANAWNTPVPGYSMATQPADRQEFALSSIYNGVETAEPKTWLRCRVYLLLDLPGSSVDVQAFLDQSTTPITLGTISYDATKTTYRTVTLPVKANGVGPYLSSYRIQYKLVLHNTDQANLDTQATPEIDHLDLEYVVSPARRREWNLRIVASDGQKRLDGTTANALTTQAAMVQKLEDLWAAHVPVVFYDAASSDTLGTPVEVKINSFVVSQYRLDTSNTDVVSEISLHLQEVVSS